MKAKRKQPCTPKQPRTPTGVEETHPGSDYTDAEREFIMAMDRFKQKNRRRFPTCRDVLQVAMELGYRKQDKN